MGSRPAGAIGGPEGYRRRAGAPAPNRAVEVAGHAVVAAGDFQALVRGIGRQHGVDGAAVEMRFKATISTQRRTSTQSSTSSEQTAMCQLALTFHKKTSVVQH